MIEHSLTGCIPTPASNYLKTLGLFKTVSTVDKDATMHWKNGHAVLMTKMSKNEILDFFIDKYRPSPVIAPWSYNKYEKTVKLIDGVKDERFDKYRKVIKAMDGIFEKFKRIRGELKINKTVIDEDKPLLVKLCRNELPDEVIPWLDVVYTVKKDKPSYAPILGTGANDGNLDISENFAKRITELLKKEKQDESRKLLESALFGNTVALTEINTIGHNPGGSGGPNSGMGFEGKSLSNPWNYVLMIEGVVLFGGNTAKKISTNEDTTTFPFTASASNVGYHTATELETDEGGEPEFRAEMWFPIWSNPCTYGEIRHFFNEGRIQLGKRHAKTGTEFARAAISLGASRGISEFQRFCILKRKGKSYLTVDAGTIKVADEPAVTLLEDIDAWLGKITKKSKEKGASKSLIQLVRGTNESIMKFCTHRRKEDLLTVLIAIGRLEKYTSSRDGFSPLVLSDRWLAECYDGTPEFRLAASIASIGRSGGVGGIRENLESITYEKNQLNHIRDSASCVWAEGAGLLKNMNNVLHRRVIDGSKSDSTDKVPINGHIPARISDIVEFLNGGIDERMGDMILPLSTIDIKHNTEYPWKNTPHEDISVLPLPEAYVILKLIHPPDEKEEIPYNMAVLKTLQAERVNDAYSRASATLQAHKIDLIRHHRIGGSAKETTVPDSVRRHLSASMLFPISQHDRKKMLELVKVRSDYAQ